jgi:hypothetical protein
MIAIAVSRDGQTFAVLVDGKVVSTHDTLTKAVAERKRLERGRSERSEGMEQERS